MITIKWFDDYQNISAYNDKIRSEGKVATELTSPALKDSDEVDKQLLKMAFEKYPLYKKLVLSRHSWNRNYPALVYDRGTDQQKVRDIKNTLNRVDKFLFGENA